MMNLMILEMVSLHCIEDETFNNLLFCLLVGDYDDPKALKQGGVAERN